MMARRPRVLPEMRHAVRRVCSCATLSRPEVRLCSLTRGGLTTPLSALSPLSVLDTVRERLRVAGPLVGR